jgi:hypothetical protein
MLEKLSATSLSTPANSYGESSCPKCGALLPRLVKGSGDFRTLFEQPHFLDPLRSRPAHTYPVRKFSLFLCGFALKSESSGRVI